MRELHKGQLASTPQLLEFIWVASVSGAARRWIAGSLSMILDQTLSTYADILVSLAHPYKIATLEKDRVFL